MTVRAGSHADVEIVTPSGLSFSVGRDARARAARRRMAPTRGGWQVVDPRGRRPAHRAAANALLKAIEEPPPRGVLLLCAPSADDLLPTIRSRCRLVRLRTPPDDAVAAQLIRTTGSTRRWRPSPRGPPRATSAGPGGWRPTRTRGGSDATR